MKRALGILGGAVALLVAGLAINTARCKADHLVVAPIGPIAVDEAAVAGRLAGAIRIQTISRADGGQDSAAFAALQQYLEGVFPKVHAALRFFFVKG